MGRHADMEMIPRRKMFLSYSQSPRHREAWRSTQGLVGKHEHGISRHTERTMSEQESLLWFLWEGRKLSKLSGFRTGQFECFQWALGIRMFLGV